MTAEARLLEGARVLVIEDEYYLADDLLRVLARAGAVVLGPVATLAQAEEFVARGGFDCVVLDMNLKGHLAYPVAERLNELGVPFLVITGYGGSSLPAGLRAQPRVEKPINPDAVVNLLAQLRNGRSNRNAISAISAPQRS